jgi:hypothetical protein
MTPEAFARRMMRITAGMTQRQLRPLLRLAAAVERRQKASTPEDHAIADHAVAEALANLNAIATGQPRPRRRTH